MPPEVQKAAEQYSRAVALDKAHKWNEATTAYEEFLKLAAAAHLPPRNLIEVNGRLTFLYQARGDQKKAEATMLRIVALDAKNPLVYVQLASLYHQQGKLPQAKEYATRALTFKPTSTTAALAHHILGAIALAKQNPIEAEKEFSLSIDAAPRNPQGYLDYAFALMQRKKSKEALVAVQRAAGLDPKMVQPKVMMAGIYQEQNRLPDALAKYDEVLHTEPRNTIALYNRAAVLHRQGNVQEAISAYLTFLNVMPGNYDAHYNLAQLYYAIANYQAARLHFTQAHNLAPKDARALASLALTEQKEAGHLLDQTQRRNEFAASETHFKEAIALAPKDASLPFSLAAVLEDTLRYDDAIVIYRKRIAESPKEIASYRRIAQAYTKQRKVVEVVKIWRDYRVQDPKNPISYQEAAEIEEKSGNWVGALEDWNALLAIKPSNGVAANTMNHMAVDLVQLKRPDEARTQYNAVLALDPTGSSAPKEYQVVEAAAVKTERLAAMRGMAALALQEKKPEEAIAALEKIKAEEAVLSAKTGLYDPEPYLTIGKLYEDQKKYEEAAAQYKTLLQLTPKNGEVWAQLGRLYESQNKQAEAIAAYLKAEALSKTPLQEGMRIAQAYQRFNQPDKAIAQYQLLRRQFPQDVSLLTALALALRQAVRDADSLEVYDTLLKIDSQLAWVREYKAIALVHLKRYPEARALYVAQVDKAPQNRQAYADLANAYKEEGKPDDYLPWLQPRLEKAPTNSILMGVVLDEFTRQNRADAGYAYLKGIVEQHKTQRPVLETFATVLAEHSKRVEAIEVYRQIAALAPKDIGAQLILADQLDMNTQKDEAAKIYKALMARPEIPADQKLALHRRFAQRCVLQGDLAEAILQYQEVLHASPKDFEAIAELAQTLVAAHRENEAIPYYQKLTQETGFPAVVRADLFSKLGDVYALQNHKPEAIVQYHEAQKLNP
ncbi:MAG: Tetratricopeptide repeat, partial [Chthonomonadales bacterium]|nr:Tetratricopeptide repeat [Chthonomonadales bacterium]